MTAKTTPEHDTFSSDLEKLSNHVFNGKVPISEIESVLKGRGFASMCMILCIPFVQPIPLPGLSVIFGFAIIALGARLAFGQKGGLPQFIKNKKIETKTLQKLIQTLRKMFAYVEKWFKPRLQFMFKSPALNLIGVSIVTSGLALSLPLPPIILFSNSIPAWAIMFLCLGFLERDGLAVTIGHGLAVATWVYFGFWWEVIKGAISKLI